MFAGTDWGRAAEARPLLERWATRQGAFTAFEKGELSVAIEVPRGEDKDFAVKTIVQRLKSVGEPLGGLNPGPVVPGNE